jgi:alpha-1,3-mannosyltransferase
MVAFTAEPIVQRQVSFRAPRNGECGQGEPQLFCKDMWFQGYGKIAVVPSVNLEYSSERARDIKALKGYTSQWAIQGPSTPIEWQPEPPERVRCMADYANQHWEDWDIGLT